MQPAVITRPGPPHVYPTTCLLLSLAERKSKSVSLADADLRENPDISPTFPGPLNFLIIPGFPVGRRPD